MKMELILKDVRYMPSISRNLISYGLLEKAGCKAGCTYEGGGFRIEFFKDGQRVITGNCRDGLYYLQGKVSISEVNISKAEPDMTKLWHSRLGQMSVTNMNVLSIEKYIQVKEMDKLEFCESCVLRKSHKQSFPTAKHTTKAILDYVHSDLWGSPTSPESLGGCKYFISFIDDFSKKV